MPGRIQYVACDSCLDDSVGFTTPQSGSVRPMAIRCSLYLDIPFNQRASSRARNTEVPHCMQSRGTTSPRSSWVRRKSSALGESPRMSLYTSISCGRASEGGQLAGNETGHTSLHQPNGHQFDEDTLLVRSCLRHPLGNLLPCRSVRNGRRTRPTQGQGPLEPPVSCPR